MWFFIHVILFTGRAWRFHIYGTNQDSTDPQLAAVDRGSFPGRLAGKVITVINVTIVGIQWINEMSV